LTVPDQLLKVPRASKRRYADLGAAMLRMDAFRIAERETDVDPPHPISKLAWRTLTTVRREEGALIADGRPRATP
jgi:hypothetical protein